LHVAGCTKHVPESDTQRDITLSFTAMEIIGKAIKNW
jgi:hypothetical protein